MLKLTLPRYKSIEMIASENKDIISFSQGAVKVGGAPEEIKAHLKEILNSDRADYYQAVGGIIPLRKKIAETLTKKWGASLSHEEILITHGSIGGITNLCLLILEAATCKNDLAALPSNHYEALGGNRKGQYSIRINKKWRICFEWPDSRKEPHHIEIVDYH